MFEYSFRNKFLNKYKFCLLFFPLITDIHLVSMLKLLCWDKFFWKVFYYRIAHCSDDFAGLPWLTVPSLYEREFPQDTLWRRALSDKLLNEWFFWKTVEFLLYLIFACVSFHTCEVCVWHTYMHRHAVCILKNILVYHI